MITSRAKFTCFSCTLSNSSRLNKETNKWDPIIAKSWKFFAVTGSSDENKRFFSSTPSGTIELNILNPEVEFELGVDYHVDFTKA